MARSAKCLAPAMVLLISSIAGSPAWAGMEPDAVLEEIRRLNQRMMQLEEDNRRLKEGLDSIAAAGREKAIVGRLEDVERQLMSQDKKTRLSEAVEGIEAQASFLMVGQRALSGTSNGKEDSRINYRADVEVSFPAGDIGKGEGELFAHFRIGQGNGLTDFPATLSSTPNSTVFALSNGDAAAVLLAQAWYELEVPLGEDVQKLEITAGKIDPFGFFDQNEIADDESSAFLNNVFVHNPLLDSGGDMDVDAYGFAPGLILGYQNSSQSPDYWKATVGVFSSGEDSSFDTDLTHPFVIGQLESGGRYLLDRPGVYRVYAWNRSRAAPYANEFDASRESHSGWGVSVNQQLAEHVTAFGRYGHSIEGKVRIDQAITLGAEIGGAYWGRGQDRVGLAAGWLDTSKPFRADAPGMDADGDGTPDFGYSPKGAESQFEIYYAWQLNVHLEITPDFQWITNPGGDDSAEDIAIVGLRARASF